jgi:outer membrane protein OmpA-like peptidoglycan-associated protein
LKVSKQFPKWLYLQLQNKIWHLSNNTSVSETNMHKSKAFIIYGLILLIVTAAVSVFSQVDIPRKTTAITYPVDELVMVNFRGTTRFPRMKGDARIKRTKRNGTEIELSVSKMPRPFELGAGYATYVLWAVSPTGEVDNLGEIKRRGFFEFDSKISVTTPLQTFALIITAEPHFLVKRPSQAIMLENLDPYTLSGRSVQTTPSVTYFGNSSDYFRDSRTPEIAEIDYSKTPSTVLQAKQAVALARYAGADRDAAEELKQAEELLQNADDSWKAGRNEESVDTTARQAITVAVKAEDTATVRKLARDKRNEQIRNDAAIRTAENRFSDAQNQIDELKTQLSEETRNRQLAERDVQNYQEQIKQLRKENSDLRDELARTKSDAETAKTRLASIEGENQSIKEQRDREAKAAQLASNEPALVANLKRFGTVSKNARGIVLTLPETFWAGPRSSGFAPNADAKMTSLADVLVNNPDYSIVIESHTDNNGTPDDLLSLTQERAKAIAERETSLGVPSARMQATGMGATLPVAPNTTAANRAKNRRVQIILSPTL